MGSQATSPRYQPCQVMLFNKKGGTDRYTVYSLGQNLTNFLFGNKGMQKVLSQHTFNLKQNEAKNTPLPY